TRRWLMAEASLTPGLAAAFDSRNQSAEHQRQWAKLEKRAYERLLKSARSQPDPDITANRIAVAAAGRGASGTAHPERPRHYGSMCDGECAKEKAKYL